MNMYYFGDSLEYIEAGYASSGRSSCRTCKQKIDKDQLRIGLILDDDHFNAKYWYHLKCFKLMPRHSQMEEDKIEQKIYNIDHLEQEDYKAVVDHMKQELQRLKNKKKKGKKQTKQTKKTKKPVKKSKKKKGQQSESESSLSESQSSSQSYSESQSEIKKKKKKGGKKTEKKEEEPQAVECKGYTQAQLEEFVKLCTKYDGMTAIELKQILAKNNQSKNGTKAQLVQKCADGKLLGQIPKCSACGGGRLRFDKQTGVYTCPGFMEDTDFIRCNKKFQLSQVTRTEWND